MCEGDETSPRVIREVRCTRAEPSFHGTAAAGDKHAGFATSWAGAKRSSVAKRFLIGFGVAIALLVLRSLLG